MRVQDDSLDKMFGPSRAGEIMMVAIAIVILVVTWVCGSVESAKAGGTMGLQPPAHENIVGPD